MRSFRRGGSSGFMGLAVEMERSAMGWRIMWEGEEMGLSYLDMHQEGSPGVPGSGWHLPHLRVRQLTITGFSPSSVLLWAS